MCIFATTIADVSKTAPANKHDSLSAGRRYDFRGNNKYSINVVGNIWEPRKFIRYLLPNDKIDAYAIA